jgi:glyoxylase-like metal-dependent hydrolase (beta-lactamase superfamily II)
VCDHGFQVEAFSAMTSNTIISPTELTFATSALASWTRYDPAIRTDLTSNAVFTSQGWWLIDPSPLSQEDIGLLIERGPILGILLSNENHERASSDLAKSLSTQVYALEAVKDLFERKPDQFFQNGNVFKGGLKAIHIPGASIGEACFFEPSQRILVMGDALIHLEQTGLALLPEKYCKDSVQAKKSLETILGLDFNAVAFAHGSPIVSDAKERVKKLIQSS